MSINKKKDADMKRRKKLVAKITKVKAAIDAEIIQHLYEDEWDFAKLKKLYANSNLLYHLKDFTFSQVQIPVKSKKPPRKS